MPPPDFRRCLVCTHAAVQRPGSCRLCGGATRAEAPPEALFSGWRCGCYQCTWTPC